MDLGFRVVEERIRALNWLGLNESFFFQVKWLYDMESMWDFMIFIVLIGKRKAVI